MWNSTRGVLDGIDDLQATSADTARYKAYLLVLLPIILLAVSGAVEDKLASGTAFPLLSTHLTRGGVGINDGGAVFFLVCHGERSLMTAAYLVAKKPLPLHRVIDERRYF